jgi:hypothetical protein
MLAKPTLSPITTTFEMGILANWRTKISPGFDISSECKRMSAMETPET